jgi:hypothetical protein
MEITSYLPSGFDYWSAETIYGETNFFPHAILTPVAVSVVC